LEIIRDYVQSVSCIHRRGLDATPLRDNGINNQLIKRHLNASASYFIG